MMNSHSRYKIITVKRMRNFIRAHIDTKSISTNIKKYFYFTLLSRFRMLSMDS